MKLRTIRPNQLGHSSDYEIYQSIESLTSKLRKNFPNWRLSRNHATLEQGLYLETELCYLQREIMWRKLREKHHAEYLENRKKSVK